MLLRRSNAFDAEANLAIFLKQNVMTHSSNKEKPVAKLEFVNGRYIKNDKCKTVIGIFTCPKHINRANGIRNTWLKLIPKDIRVLFVFGRPGKAASLEGENLYLDCEESYEKLPHKSHAFFDFCYHNLDFDYIFKTDDDTYLDMEKFLNFDKKEADYIGQFKDSPLKEIGKTWHYGKCTDKSYEVPDDSEFICGWATGAGYFLSKKAVETLIKETASMHNDYIFEDRMVGEAFAAHADIKVFQSSFFDMGLINPLLHKDMIYVQNILESKRIVTEELRLLKEKNEQLEIQLQELSKNSLSRPPI
jgi:hypothetical protein